MTTLSESEQKTLEKLLAKSGQKVVQDDAAKREKAQKMRVLWENMAKEAGLTPGYVWFATGKNGGKKNFKVTHRNPDNPSQTWKGIGNIPKWAREKLGKEFKDVRDLPHAELLKLMEPYLLH
jgi:DNA-binding protein H-NS